MVINTYGWIQGLGLEVLTEILSQIKVTHFVRFVGHNARQNLPDGAFWMESAEMHSTTIVPIDYGLPPMLTRDQDQGQRGFTAVERRAMQWNGFAISCCDASGNFDMPKLHSKAPGDAIASQPPFRVPLHAVTVKSIFDHIPSGQILRALNGSVVGLCARGDSQSEPACLGIGIVRAVSAQENLLYILTPLRGNLLNKVNHIILGKLELPPALLQTDSHKSPYLALHALSTGGTGAGSGKARNNLMRLSQL